MWDLLPNADFYLGVTTSFLATALWAWVAMLRGFVTFGSQKTHAYLKTPESFLLLPRWNETIEVFVDGLRPGRKVWLLVETGAGIYPVRRSTVRQSQVSYSGVIVGAETDPPGHATYSLVFATAGRNVDKQFERFRSEADRSGDWRKGLVELPQRLDVLLKVPAKRA